ncbi:AMP-binding protein [Sporosarcina sp. FSL W7-1349]|uniref:AMP-binding protein n=1 Tax=Sporosarcina sp. FSL W7-1349 TaxID=2921561 RepID=UPI0030F993F4
MRIDVTSLFGRRNVNRWERMSVGDMLERVTYSFPDKEAIIGWEGAYADQSNARLTYRQANEKVNQFANGLLEKGLKRGDKILLFCDNSVEALIGKIGIAKAGLVAVPMNTMMAPDVIDYLIKFVEPQMLMVDAEHWEKVGPVCEENKLLPSITIPIGGEVIPGSRSFEHFIANRSKEEPDVEIHGDDIWELLFTSGTTSMPKAVMISHTNTYLASYNFSLSLTRGIINESQLKICSFLPVIYHVGDQPFAFSNFLAGGTMVIGRKVEQGSIAEAVTKEKVTALWAGSPAFLSSWTDFILARQDKYNISSLTVIVYGWSSLSPKYNKHLKTLCGDDLVLFEIFGQTESITCYRFWHDMWPETYEKYAPHVNYVGVPSAILASVIMDEEGNVIQEHGLAGEAVYRSPAIMSGYYKDEEATRNALRHGWFHSGDSCMYDEEGLAVMVDRYKDIVKSGGENVSSIRVETVLMQHPAVERAAAIGLPDERWGEVVTGIVVMKQDVQVTEDELIHYCRESLAGFETPKQIFFVDKLPETVGGKVLKYRLRKQFSHEQQIT